MKNKSFYQVDEGTGELVEVAESVIIRKKASCQYGGFMLANLAGFDKLSGITSAQDLRVALKLLSRLDYENEIYINQKALAQELGIDRTNVSRSIKRLIDEHGIIERGPAVNGVKSYRLNPAIAWRGSAKSHARAINSRAAAAGLTVLDGGKS